jgi:hypothetical protein
MCRCLRIPIVCKSRVEAQEVLREGAMSSVTCVLVMVECLRIPDICMSRAEAQEVLLKGANSSVTAFE